MDGIPDCLGREPGVLLLCLVCVQFQDAGLHRFLGEMRQLTLAGAPLTDQELAHGIVDALRDDEVPARRN